MPETRSVFDNLQFEFIDSGEPNEGFEVDIKHEASVFDALVPEDVDSTLQSWLRSAYQIPAGAAKKFTFPLDLVQMLSHVGDPETLADLRHDAILSGEEFNEEAFQKGFDEAAQLVDKYFPTQENLEKLIEEQTGLPLQ
ncbi:MAG: hypothetical protein VW258_15060, partial [Thalassolituus sp.]